MQPLIITGACGYARPPVEGAPPETLEELAQSAVDAWRAGAAVVQIRVPGQIDAATGRPQTKLESWIDVIGRIRNECDVLIHAGVAAMQIEARIEMLETVRPDFASFLLGHHDIMTRGRALNSLRPIEDAETLGQAHVATGVRPEFEIFSAGSVWKLNELLRRVEMPRPLATTLFFGWSGGEWSPPTPEELLHRVPLLPADASWTITTVGAEQTAMHALAIARGGHVRIGLGDYPYIREGEFADSTRQMVERIVRLAAEFERPIATPAQAAAHYGIKRSS